MITSFAMWEGPPRKIRFTPEKLTAYRAAYQKAVDEGAEEFMFEDHEWLTSYAKYMIEYLETVPELKEVSDG
tara:strand:+ start:2858 stop:3073 length:216 start_codon:yes stop_codon:yes gene_type:complete